MESNHTKGEWISEEQNGEIYISTQYPDGRIIAFLFSFPIDEETKS